MNNYIMKYIGILFTGIHYLENYPHFTNKNYTIDFRKYVKNIKIKIYKYFEKEYKIDTFLCTNNSIYFSELLKTYSPIGYCIEDGNHCLKKAKGLKFIQNYIKTSKKNYDFILMTRFDIYIMKEFTCKNIDINKLNIVSVLESDELCDDNLYIIPIEYFNAFTDFIYEICINNINKIKPTLLHFQRYHFESMFKVNYIENELKNVGELSFFKLRYLEEFNYIINRFLLSENVQYNSLNNEYHVFLKDGIIEFSKNENYENCWIGYEIDDPGIYLLSFEVFMDKITDFQFIRTKSKKYIPILSKENEWIKMSVFIEITEKNEIIYFDFTDFLGTIHIKYREIQCVKQDICIFNDIQDENVYNYHIQKKDNTYEFVPLNTIMIMNRFGYIMTPKTTIKFDILLLSNPAMLCINIRDFVTYDCIKTSHFGFIQEQSIEIPIVSKRVVLIEFIFMESPEPVHFLLQNIEFIPDEINYKFISFYTQGSKYDKCMDLTKSANKYKEHMERYMDTVRFYTAFELVSQPDTEYLVKEFEDEPLYNQKTHLIGYLRWKPYIILTTLLDANYGDIIYYRDSNIVKYPAILDGIESTIDTLQFVLQKNDLFIPIENYPLLKMKHNVKSEVFQHFDLYNDETMESYLLNASIIVCRKTDLVIEFMRDWLDACKNDDLISCKYNDNQHSEFKWNTQEQAIMNILMQKYIKMGKFPEDYNKYSVYNRSFTVDSIKHIQNVSINS